MGIQIIASYRENGNGETELVPYIDFKNDVPDSIPATGLEVGMRYVVEVWNVNGSIGISVKEKILPGQWINEKIRELKLENQKQIRNNQRISTDIPDDIFISQIQWDILISSIRQQQYSIMTGPSGIGKTVIARAAAKSLGYNFYSINCGNLQKPKQSLVGTVKAENGTTSLVESLFLKHFRSTDPTVIFLDEISRIPTVAENYMMTILDKEQSYMYVEEFGEVIIKGDNVIFISAANFGMEYVSTRALDEAFMDRFVPIHLSYLSEEQEIKLVNVKLPGLVQSDVRRIVKVASTIRKNADTIGRSISHRKVIQIAGYLREGFTSSEIIDNLIVNLFVNGGDDRREQVKQIISAL